MNSHLINHGDGVKDVAIYVENCKAVFENSVANGGVAVSPPTEMADENGTLIVSTVKTYGDTTHTFIQNINYKGPFLPGFQPHPLKEIFNTFLEPIKFEKIDHIVGNQPDLMMEPAVNYY
jgi:4-hydroxyphenylpyruvate dioxygenase